MNTGPGGTAQVRRQAPGSGHVQGRHRERRDLCQVLRAVVRPLQAAGTHLGRAGRQVRCRRRRDGGQGGLHVGRQQE